ncbi:hypothetical protein MMF93_00385 [Streptomyces tubbatahanensis]|uniref:ABC transporter permease n=1 Tax=Streptomyces tubbatahanensis TaxID=2923272 RepID=A0ABY3XL06_9ACTN|nr:hypothetical protein [Streptomyces tubbatahanensis]UNS95089.1 hypothetical protein MMF93_00385 [Streptomyces tubbatahanensis]
MNLRARIRTSSALWASPLVIAFTLFYAVHIFGVDYPDSKSALPYAPEVVSYALQPFYGLTYAVVSALSAWEAGRLTQDGVWRLASVRSRLSIAAGALWPVLALGWLMLALAAGLALAQEGVAPTPGSLQLPAMAAVLTLGHCVIGFTVGRLAPRLLAAPLLAVGVFYLVAFAGAGQFSDGGANWSRHLSGSYAGFLAFGELATWSSLAAHVLPTIGLAAGLGLLWCGSRSTLTRVIAVVAACLVTAGASTTAYRIASDWEETPPTTRAHLPTACAGELPRVCVPRQADQILDRARNTITDVTTTLGTAGVHVDMPRKVTDSLLEGRYRTTGTEWHLPLTQAERDGALRYRVLRAAGTLPCAHPHRADASALRLWQAHQVGEDERYLEGLRGDVIDPGNDTDLARIQRAEDARVAHVKARVNAVLKQTDTQQRSWYRTTLAHVCPARGGTP